MSRNSDESFLTVATTNIINLKSYKQINKSNARIGALSRNSDESFCAVTRKCSPRSRHAST